MENITMNENKLSMNGKFGCLLIVSFLIIALISSCGSAGGGGGGTDDGGGGGGDALSDPVAEALVSDLTVFVGEQISLDASGSTDPDGSLVNYEWDMGDGENPVSGETQTYTYIVAGTYTVTLTVTDNDGNTNSVTVTVTVSDGSPMADAGGPYDAALVNTAVTFDGSASSDPNGSIANYNWVFGDGGSDSDATLSGTSYTYSAPSTPGSYTVTLTVTDDDGKTDSDTADIRIHQVPLADAGGNQSAEVGAVVNFDGSGSEDQDSDGSISSYAWDLNDDGDYKDAVGTTASKSWAVAGTYTVGLRVIDNDGAADTDEITVTVVETGSNQPPTADAGGPYPPLIVGTAFTFVGSASADPDGSITSWSWDFDYDGSTHNEDEDTENPINTYTNIGEYTIHLEVTDNDGATGSDTTTVIVHQKPTADINDIGNPTIVLNGESFTLSASNSQPDSGASGGPVDFIAEYRWDFESDGTVDVTTSVPTVSYTYTSDGVKTVELSVLDSSGEESTNTDTFSITVHQAVTADSGGPYIGSGAGNDNVFQLGDSILLDASGSSDPDTVGSGSISSFSWDFDYDGVSFHEDATGETSTLDVLASPVNNTPGTYTMAVKVADPDDPTVTDIATLNYKVNAAPTADFTFSPTNQYAVGSHTWDALTGETLTFDASSSSDSDGTLAGYEWDFGDGSSSGVVTGNGITHSYVNAGTYTVELVVTDDDGAQSTGVNATVKVAEECDVEVTVE